jgi:hypothetical protein
MAKRKLTDEALKSLLWETAQKVATGTIDPQQGAVVAQNAREIISIERTKIQALKAGLLSKDSDQKLIG